MSESETDPGKLETWAIVEVMGHNRYAGFVQQVPFGGAAMIRVDVPEIAEYWVDMPDWENGGQPRRHLVPGTPAFTKFLGISSIFAITPCTQEAAMAAVRAFRSAPVTILDLPQRRALPQIDAEDADEPE